MEVEPRRMRGGAGHSEALEAERGRLPELGRAETQRAESGLRRGGAWR